MAHIAHSHWGFILNWTNFKLAGHAATMKVMQFTNFVRKNPGAQAALLALAGDMLVPLFRDGWSYGATAVFTLGETALFLSSKDLRLGKAHIKLPFGKHLIVDGKKIVPWLPAIGYAFFAVGMELLTHSTGVAHNPLLKLNLHAFSRLDIFWSTAASLRASSAYVRKIYPHRYKLARKIRKSGDKGVVLAGTLATCLHLPGIGGSIGLSGPLNLVTFGGHVCWLAADYIMGGVQKAGGMALQGTEWTLERPPVKRILRGPDLVLLNLNPRLVPT